MGSCARPENSRWIYWPLAQVGGGGEERASEASAPSNCRKKKRKEIRLWIFLRYKYKSLSIFSVYTFHFFHRNCNTWWSNVVSVVYVSKKSSNSDARYRNAVWFSSRTRRVYACHFSQFGLKIWWGPCQPPRAPPPAPNLPIVFHDLLYIDQPVGFVQVMENMESHASCSLSLSSPPT